MLRTAADKTVRRCGSTVYRSIRLNGTQAPVRKGSLAKKIFITTGLTAGVAGSAIGYAYYDPVFKGKLQETVPYASELFGCLERTKNNVVEKTKKQSSELKNKAMGLLPSRKTKEPTVVEEEKPLLRLGSDPVEKEGEKPLLRLEPPPEAEPVSKPPVVIEPVDLKLQAASITPAVDPDMNLRARKNRELEASLKAALMSSESRVKLATEAKLATIAAIGEHAKLLKSAAGNSQGAEWDRVSEAVERVERSGREDLAEENDARNYLDNIRMIINEGKREKMTRYNPLLINAAETVNKMEQQLDELRLAVRKSRDESRRDTQFRDLIERSRRVYADELKILIPGVDLKARDSALTEDDLNMIIAHAHLKVTQLRQQLADQQAQEEANITKAIEEQRLADAKIAEEELSLEIKHLKDQLDLDFERKLLVNRKEWEEETEERLVRAAAAHSDHLEQVVRTQRQLCDIEQAQKVEKAVAAERAWNSEQISSAQKKLESIEAALNSRVAADVENRRSKQFWIACQNLVDSVVHGKKAGLSAEDRRTPLLNELKVIKESSAGDEYVEQVLNAFSDDSIREGVFPEQDLKSRFAYLYKVARRVAKVDDNGGGIMQYFSSYLQNAITFDLPRKYSHDDKIDPESIDTYEVLSRAKYFVDNGDLTAAVRMVQLLSGEPGRLARDWIRDARAHLETRFLVELLIAHAAVLSIRTTY